MAKRRGPRRNKHQRAQDLKKISELRVDKKSLREIAEQVDLSHEQVRQDLAFIDRQLLESAQQDLELIRSQAIAKLRHAQVQAHQAWMRSLDDAEKVSTKKTADGTEETTTREGQSGAPGHIRNYIRAIEAEAKLLNLYDIGTGKGDEAAQRLLELHTLLEAARADYDTQKASATEPTAK